jgi:sugar/nucleoside kinase (ribokinase family)
MLVTLQEIIAMAYPNCAVFSSAVSALKCTGMGARERVPDLETTKKFLKENGYEL